MANPPKILSPVCFTAIATKYLVGKCINMSLSDDKTGWLWQEFMSKHRHITHTVNTNLYSVEYFPCILPELTPKTRFEKWAAVEVNEFTDIPKGLDTLIIKAGLYAVFIHQGNAKSFPQTLEAILTQWLPQSAYQYDNRAQFEIMPANYRPDDPHSVEQIWIPITRRL